MINKKAARKKYQFTDSFLMFHISLIQSLPVLWTEVSL